MIDLNKIQERFDFLFETETEDSFQKWVENKKKSEIIGKYGRQISFRAGV